MKRERESDDSDYLCRSPPSNSHAFFFVILLATIRQRFEKLVVKMLPIFGTARKSLKKLTVLYLVHLVPDPARGEGWLYYLTSNLYGDLI